MASRRLFFALEPPGQTRRAIASVKRACLAVNQGRAVAEENLHLTLQFLGAVAEEGIDGLVAAADQLLPPRFTLSLDCFGHWEGPRVLWMGPQITPVPLLALQRGLEGVLQQQCEIVPSGQGYRPHVTLMRKVRRVNALPQLESIEWPVVQFSLMESLSDGQGVRYRPLYRWG